MGVWVTRTCSDDFSPRCDASAGWREDLALEAARGCLQSGGPGSGVAEIKVNSGYFRTHGKRGQRCVCQCALACVGECVCADQVQAEDDGEFPQQRKSRSLTQHKQAQDLSYSRPPPGGFCVVWRRGKMQRIAWRTRLFVATVGGRNLGRSRAGCGCVRGRLGRYLCTGDGAARYGAAR